MSRLLAAARMGTRPAAIKLAFVVYALKARNQEFEDGIVRCLIKPFRKLQNTWCAPRLAGYTQ
jgi:hypothetical protein